jgi:preprotein translocase subunit SecF
MFLPEFQIDTFFITALLTILGYSINDTIVVFDRIRSNLEKYA